VDGEDDGEAGEVRKGQVTWPTMQFLEVERQLGMPLVDYLREAIEEGRSVRLITRWLVEDSGVSVSDVTIGEWIGRLELKPVRRVSRGLLGS
jgi:hypothetical protein